MPVCIELGPAHVIMQDLGVHSIWPYTDAYWPLPVTRHMPELGALLAKAAHRSEQRNGITCLWSYGKYCVPRRLDPSIKAVLERCLL